MERFLNYSTADFVRDDDFIHWVSNGRQHVLVDKRWRNWIEDHPHKADDVEEARMLVLTLAQEPPVVASKYTRAHVWNRIQTTLKNNSEPVEPPPLIFRWYSKVAVTIALLALLAIFIVRHPAKPVDHDIVQVETGVANTLIVSARREAHTVVLRDGTSIVLMPGSILEYSRDFDELHRDVYLSGEAYFEVSDESTQPFVVKTSQLTLAGLGTSFNVRGYENEHDTRVQVKRGRAAITQNDAQSSGTLVLMANHQVVFQNSDTQMVPMLVDNPGILVPLAQANFVYRNTPISTVLESIENAYGIEIIFNEFDFSDCTLDADLNELPLYGKLKAICEKIGCKYEVVEAHIVMQGGCHHDFARR